MKALRTWNYWLLVGALLTSAGCNDRATFKPPYEVHIKDCNAPQVDVHHQEQVHWNSDDAGVTYTIDFSSTEPTPSPFTVTSSSTKPRVMKGHSKCRHNTATNGCWYKYTLTKSGENSPCADPVIHIVPGP